ncbi:hypothetical protein B6U84_03550 [Candidatus Bathyarchaeota archaeon ex4484_40]|nr:MAG: hypothetical protein B6U84_03550 [Candidatus Bathyarchaeota archaeon ex4484_40]
MGADYAEARFQSDITETVTLKNGVPDASTLSETEGLSVRVIFKGALGFASTNMLNRRASKEAAKRALEGAKAASKAVRLGVKMGGGELGRGRVEVRPRVSFEHVDMDARLELLKEADERALEAVKDVGAHLPARIFTLDTWITEKTIITSDGVNVSSSTPRVALSVFMTAYHPQRGTAQRFFDLGETAGWEAVERWNLTRLFREEAYSLGKVLMEAEKPPKGVVDLVLGPEVIGLVSHESSGHPSEADRILGREAAQAGETYLKKDSLGMKVGSQLVNVVDDPTIERSFGFYLYDDEGVMEWNIDDRRLNQRYVGLEAYRIEGGEVKGLVRNPVLEVTTTGLWSAVDAVGRDLQFQAAYCGKSDPMQGIPVWTGGPHTRLRGIRLGGRT